MITHRREALGRRPWSRSFGPRIGNAHHTRLLTMANVGEASQRPPLGCIQLLPISSFHAARNPSKLDASKSSRTTTSAAVCSTGTKTERMSPIWTP